eukprot:297172-Pelagomonas_calceolata.AAC.3
MPPASCYVHLFLQKNETEAAETLEWNVGFKPFPSPALESEGVLRQVGVWCISRRRYRGGVIEGFKPFPSPVLDSGQVLDRAGSACCPPMLTDDTKRQLQGSELQDQSLDACP